MSTNQRGIITLEILIAMTIIVLVISSVILVVFSNQKLATDALTNNEALFLAQAKIDASRFTAALNFSSIISDPLPIADGIYAKQNTVTDISPCLKQLATKLTWNMESRAQYSQLNTLLSSPTEAIAMGGDCASEPPAGGWTNPARFASDTISPGQPTALDVLNKIAYEGSDHAPYLFIADTNTATLGQTSGIFIDTGGFNPGFKINAIEAIRDPATGKNYLFTAMNNMTNQLEVIDVTDIHNPVLVATRALSSCVAGSSPQGWRVRYYGGSLYLTTRYTAGPEFHIFNVINPANPIEFNIGGSTCKGLDLGDTVNDIAIQDKIIGAITKRFAYFATDESNKELRVFDVTNPLAITEVLAANQDLPGIQNGLSLFATGNTLYFGRQSTPGGPDLYAYNTSNPSGGLPLLGSQDINTSIFTIRVAGRFAFLATARANKEFQVWNISNLSSISLIKEYNFGNIVEQGMDYEPDFIYATGVATPNFQILYSP